MRYLKEYILAALMIAATIHTASGQSIEPFNPYAFTSPGVEAFSMTKYGVVSPSLYTGAMSYSVPVYTYEDPDFTIPVSLEYNFNGYKPAQHSGSVGYGWFLNCGGVITREVRGLPDEHLSSRIETGYSINQLTLTTHSNYIERRGYYYTCTNTNIDVFSCPVKSKNYIPQRNDIVLVAESESVDLFSDMPVYFANEHNYCKYDTAPDIFHFRFNNYHGDFMLTEDGTVKVFNSNLPEGQVSVNFDPGQYTNIFVIVPTITISTGDGYEYTFGGNISAIDCSYSHTTTPAEEFVADSYNGPITCASAIRLVSVKAPNGRTAEYNYAYNKQEDTSLSVSRREYRYNYPSASYVDLDFVHQTDSLGQPVNMNDISHEKTLYTSVYYSHPTSVTVDGEAVISFGYRRKEYNESSRECFTEHRMIDSLMLHFSMSGFQTEQPECLHSITFSNQAGDIVQEAELSHTYAPANSRKMFLSGLSTTRDGSYTFEYDSSQGRAPFNNTSGTDYWGYWNGKDDNAVLYQRINIANVGVYDLYNQITGNGNDPDCDYARHGALTRINYPTGGHTLISYEGNRVTNRIHNMDEEPFFLQCDTMAVGGVRVLRVENYDKPSRLSGSTDYSYRCGTLVQMPLYCVAVSFTHFRPVISVAIPDENFSSTFSLCLNYTNDTHSSPCRDDLLGYQEVMETYMDGSRTEYVFSGIQGGYGDEFSTIGTDKDSFYSEMDKIERRFHYNTPCVIPPVYDHSAMRGLLLNTRCYDASNHLVKETENTYAVDTVGIQNAIYNNLYTFKAEPCNFCFPKKISVNESEYSGGVAFGWSMGYIYNSFGQPVCESSTSGIAGDTVKVYYKYLHETNGSSLKGILSDAVKTRKADGTEYITATEHYSYSSPSVHSKPSSVTAYDVLSPVILSSPSSVFSSGRDGSSRQTGFTYDSRLRLTGVSLPGGDSISFTWAGNNISSATRSGTGNTSLYEWKDLVGLTKSTSPSGMYESYTYDNKNRLQTVKDTEGDTVTEYNYSLYNE